MFAHSGITYSMWNHEEKLSGEKDLELCCDWKYKSVWMAHTGWLGLSPSAAVCGISALIKVSTLTFQVVHSLADCIFKIGADRSKIWTLTRGMIVHSKSNLTSSCLSNNTHTNKKITNKQKNRKTRGKRMLSSHFFRQRWVQLNSASFKFSAELRLVVRDIYDVQTGKCPLFLTVHPSASWISNVEYSIQIPG